jgi:hypothetical protein
LHQGPLSYPVQNTAVSLAAALALAVVVFLGSPAAERRGCSGSSNTAAAELLSYSVLLWSEPVMHFLAATA